MGEMHNKESLPHTRHMKKWSKQLIVDSELHTRGLTYSHIHMCVCTHSRGRHLTLAEIFPTGFQCEYKNIRAKTCIRSLSASSL